MVDAFKPGSNDDGKGGNGGSTTSYEPICELSEMTFEDRLPSIETSFENNMFTMTASEFSQQSFVKPTGRPFVRNTNLEPEVELEPVKNGVNVHLTYMNETSEPQALGILTLGGIQFGHSLEMRDLRYDTKSVSIQSYDPDTGQRFVSDLWNYPKSLYSPVIALKDDDYQLVMSLMYDSLSHGIRTNVQVPGGSFISEGHNWEAEFRLDDELEVGQQRSYSLSIRFLDADDSFLYGLVPYYNHFKENYGELRYERDPRPIQGITTAQKTKINEDTNPYGFTGGADKRPDLSGWGEHVEDILDIRAEGQYRGAMMWSPTGLFSAHAEGDPGSDLNYTFLFMTHMHTQEMQNSMHLLGDVPAEHFEMGYWWGRSTQVMYEWNAVPDDPTTWDPLDLDNEDHRDRALAEMDRVQELGGTMVGLDAFQLHVSTETAYLWLQELQDLYPEILFVTEGTHPDIFHSLAPTWVDNFRVTDEHHLADFLNRGHETWAGVRFDLLGWGPGWWNQHENQRQELKRLTELGYTVLPWQNVPLQGESFEAHETWHDTVPDDLTCPS